MRLGITWTDAATVVVSTVGIYIGFLVLIKLVGQRAVASMSSFDFAAAIALGAVMGRTVAGYTPTLAAGLLGMATLFALQLVFGLLRRSRRLDHALSTLPLLLMADGAVLQDNLRRAQIAEGRAAGEAAAGRHPPLRGRGGRDPGAHGGHQRPATG